MNRQFSQRWHRCVQASAAVDQLFVSRLLSVQAPFSSLAQSVPRLALPQWPRRSTAPLLAFGGAATLAMRVESI